MIETTQIAYLFDPLCGWCYGASSLMAQLAAAPGVKVVPQPTGLFSGAGARPMDASFAAYAWSNDERIAGLTRQRFTEAYRTNVLSKGGRLDSGPATLALSAVARTAPDRELDALRAIQEARYVSGLDVTAVPVLVAVLEGLGLEAAASDLLSPTGQLIAFHEDRLLAAQALMRGFAIQGVPAVVVDDGVGKTLLRAQDLFGNAALLSKLIRSDIAPVQRPQDSHRSSQG